MSIFNQNPKIDAEDTNCPECGRPLWSCVSGEDKRYCGSCNVVYEVRKDE